MKRSEIGAFISGTLKVALASQGYRNVRVEAAMGGEKSPSGIYQGYDIEGFHWGGDFGSLVTVKKLALPGDIIDFYVSERGLDGELITNLLVQVPDPARGIKGRFKFTGEPERVIANRRRVRGKRV